MKLFLRRRIYVNLILSIAISLLLISPLIFELMDYNPFGKMRSYDRQPVKFAFLLATTGLIGKVFELIEQKQQVEVENEKLRADNLQCHYDVLLKQVSPHFFFNSINSPASLVREGRKEIAFCHTEGEKVCAFNFDGWNLLISKEK